MSTQTEAPVAATAATGIRPSLFAFAIFYGGMVCIAGVLGNKQVALGPLAVEGAAGASVSVLMAAKA